MAFSSARAALAQSNLAADANLHVFRQAFMPNAKQVDQGALDSEWIIMARTDEAVNVIRQDSRWQPVARQSGQSLWSDDYSNLFRALVWHRLLWKR